jgi:hypothetical protein
MDSTHTDKIHLEQLLDQMSASFHYFFRNGFLKVQGFGESHIDDIRMFVTLLEQNSTPIIRLDLASNLIDVRNINIFILLVDGIGDEGMKYLSQSLK